MRHVFMLAAAAALLLSVVPARALADDPIRVNTTVSEQRVNTGDSLTLEINVVSHVDGAIELEIPDFDGLTELSRSKSEGTSISWSQQGQQITREYTVTIELEAEKAGKHTIPPITARASGKSAKSQPIPIEVGGVDPTSTLASKADPQRIEPPGQGEQRLFLRYKVDRATAYVGQQILVDLDVYAAPSLNFAIEENAPPPTLDGFWREVVEQPQRLTRRVENVGGRTYQVYRLWRLALFPLEPGERTIPQTQLVFAVNRSIFGGGQRDRRRAPPIALEIKDLPSEGRPASFNKVNVGAYKLAATVDHPTVPAGKAIVLKVSLTGRGNIKSARLPEVTAIPGFRVFPATITDNTEVSAGGVAGEKRAEILLMPERGGRLEIPALEMVVFNPEEERYDRLATQSIRVVVEGDPAALQAANAANAAAESKMGGDQTAGSSAELAKSDMRPLRFRSTLAAHGAPPWTSPLFLAAFFAPPGLYALMLFGEVIVARRRRETPESRRRAAARHARMRLEKAREAAKAGDGARAYHEFNEALLDFATEKTGVAFRGMTNDEMKRTLERQSAPESLVDRFAVEMENADYARFVPGATSPEAVAGSMERWEALLSELEQWAPADKDKEARK